MSEQVISVNYDRAAISVGIVHFGVGNFHRSHQAMYLDRLLREGAASDWGICGVGVLPADRRMRDALRAQDLTYTLVERPADGSMRATQIGSIVDYLYAPDEMGTVLERLAHPATRIVSLTITEGGYNINDATGQFDETNPAMVADAAGAEIPHTVFGIITAGLRLRRERGITPFTVMSCDNIEGNGIVARRSFEAFARMSDPSFADWIGENVAFPNSMVDRITPVTTDEDRAFVTTTFGLVDAWPVLCEDFVQWVLEDHFPLGRPPFQDAGVQLVDDVRPYELMKLRLLNASHQAMAYAGLLAGHVYAHEAAADAQIVALLRSYMDEEATPTLEPVPGVELDEYKRDLIRRFGNPHVRDTLSRLATDTSDRIPKFLLPVARVRREQGHRSPIVAEIVAGWARYAEIALLEGGFRLEDRQEPAVLAAVERQERDETGFLQNPEWFGELATDPAFCTDFARAHTALLAQYPPKERSVR